MSHPLGFIHRLGLAATLMTLLCGAVQAATCTSKATGNWSSSSTWTCTGSPTATVPGSSDSAVLASPYTVTLDNNNNNGNFSTINLTINSGATLTDSNGNSVTVSGNIVNNGIFTSSNNGYIYSTGSAAVISGSGSFQSSARLATSGTGPSIAAGSNLSFTGSAQFRVGRDANGNAVSGSVLTINGTLTGTSQTGGTSSPFMRLYASNTIVSSTGAINAGTQAAIVFYSGSTATLSNNGSVVIGTVSRSQGTGVWTNGANASLTVNTAFASSSVTLNASASGNTVTYNSPATPITPSSNTYFNLAGTGVTCPISYTIATGGTSPCKATTYVTGSPTSCTSVTGVGSVAWSNPSNAKVSDSAYATASLNASTGSNYLSCTGFNLNVPTGAVISGITVSVTRHTSGGTIKDAYVYLIKNSVISTAFNGATSTSYPTSDAVESHGGQTSLWGTTWSVADLNSANFGVAFSAQNTTSSWWCGGNGGWSCTNSASVNLIQVRVDYVVAGLHHIRIEHDSVAAYCLSEPITLKACANAACTSYYTASDVTGIGLSALVGGVNSGNTWTPGSPATIYAASGGVNSGITLAHSSAAVVTLGITGTSSPAPGNSAECYNTGTGVSGDCSLTFSSGAFSFHVGDHVAGTPQIVSMTSCASSMASGTRSVSFWTTYMDPATGTLKANVAAGSSNASCTSGSTVGATSGTAVAVPLWFDSAASPLTTFTLCYPDVGRVQLNAQYVSGGTTIAGSSSFVARPHHFAVSNIKCTSATAGNCGAGALAMATPGTNPAAANASGSAFMAAGISTVAASQFSATVSSINALGAVTPNYGREIAPEGLVLTPVAVSPVGGDAGLLTCKASITGCTVPGGSTNFSAGATTLTDLAWNEVGVLTLQPALVDGSYLGTGDVGAPAASGNIGRFYPYQFAVVPANMENRADLCSGGLLISNSAVTCDAFTYMGELMYLNFQLIAQEAGGTLTKNYISSATASENFAKLNLSSSAALHLGAVNAAATPTYLSARLDTSQAPSGSFLVGSADVIVPLTLTRGAAADGPYAAVNFGVAPVDTDGVALAPGAATLGTTSASGDHAPIDVTELRYGRMRLQNAYGSELLALPVPFETQYWAGNYYATNTADSNTTLPLSSLVMGNYKSSLTPCKTTLSPSTSVTLVAGKLPGVGLVLSAPGANSSGSVDLSLNLGATPSGNTCLSSAQTSATAANLPWLGVNPTARATFGLYKSPLIYRRENY